MAYIFDGHSLFYRQFDEANGRPGVQRDGIGGWWMVVDMLVNAFDVASGNDLGHKYPACLCNKTGTWGSTMGPLHQDTLTWESMTTPDDQEADYPNAPGGGSGGGGFVYSQISTNTSAVVGATGNDGVVPTGVPYAVSSTGKWFRQIAAFGKRNQATMIKGWLAWRGGRGWSTAKWNQNVNANTTAMQYLCVGGRYRVTPNCFVHDATMIENVAVFRGLPNHRDIMHLVTGGDIMGCSVVPHEYYPLVKDEGLAPKDVIHGWKLSYYNDGAGAGAMFAPKGIIPGTFTTQKMATRRAPRRGLPPIEANGAVRKKLLLATVAPAVSNVGGGVSYLKAPSRSDGSVCSLHRPTLDSLTLDTSGSPHNIFVAFTKTGTPSAIAVYYRLHGNGAWTTATTAASPNATYTLSGAGLSAGQQYDVAIAQQIAGQWSALTDVQTITFN